MVIEEDPVEKDFCLVTVMEMELIITPYLLIPMLVAF